MKRTVKLIEDCLEYLLLLVVILECNSMYGSVALTEGTTKLSMVFYALALFLSGALVVLGAARHRDDLRQALRGAGVPAALAAYGAAFYLLNVRAAEGKVRLQYALGFLLLLPLWTALFRLRRREGRPFELLYKHSDLMCALAGASLVVWLASVIRPDAMPSDVIYSVWSGRGRIVSQTNLLDVCQFVHGSKWQMFGITLLRNKSLFAEPLMFALPLLLALYTELFLRQGADPRRPYRWALLSAALVMANATIALMLLALAWAIKGAAACASGRRRWLVLPIALAAICACGVLYMEKDKLSYDDTEVSGSSLGVHIDDYRVSLRAFADSPLVGNGYQNEDAVRGYMSPWRLEKNYGLSNTAGVILAEGGAMLGALCLLPFAVCLFYLFRRRSRRVACWAMGPLAAMFGIIFKYHLLLMLLMAFGYSLIDLERTGGGLLRPALAKLPAGEWEQRPDARARRRAAICGLAVLLLGAALVCFGGPVWSGLHRFLRSRQLSLGQSPLRAFCFTAALVLNGAMLGAACRGELSWRRVAALGLWDGLYLALYPRLFAALGTLAALWGRSNELAECLLLLLAYLFPAAALVLAAPRRWSDLRGAALAGGLAALACAALLVGRGALDGNLSRAEALAPALEHLAEAASGPVFVDDLPLLYARRVKGLSLPATHRTGYDAYAKATVVLPRGEARRELLEAGFQLAELGEAHLAYTNDPAVIAALAEAGTALYRYYPFERDVAPGEAAVLDEGRYTLRCALSIDPGEYASASKDAVACRIIVTRNGGADVLGQKKVALSRFDGSGEASAEVSFKLSALCEDVTCRVEPGDDFQVAAGAMALRQTPEYVTVTAYNCHRDPVREAYYALDGTPYLQAKGYAALERDYNMADRVVAVRYYGAEGQPVLMNGDYFEVRYGYNNKGNRNREAYYGPDGAPMQVRDGYAAVQTERDAYGNPCVLRYFDAEGDPTTIKAGYAELRREFNDKKQVVREAYYGPDGQPVALEDGQFGIEQTYDDVGNVASRRYLGADGQPMTLAAGYAELRWEYDEQQRVVREAYFDADGAPALLKQGYAADEREYDDGGNVAVQRYLGLDGQPTVTGSGYAEVRRAYNGKRQKVRESYYGPDGEPIAVKGGYCGYEQTYDDAGNVASRRYLDADGSPTTISKGYAEYRRYYNSRKQVIREEYYGPDGQPVALKKGYAALERDYDANGKLVARRYFDLSGNPVDISE